MSDRVFGAIGIAVAAFFIWQATLIQESFISDPVGPKTFPIIIGAVLGLSSLVFLLMPDERPDWPAAGRLIEIFMAAVVMVAYALALPEVGFVAATSLAGAYLSWRLGAGWIAAIIAGVVMAVGIFVIFRMILGLSLAVGPWGF